LQDIANRYESDATSIVLFNQIPDGQQPAAGTLVVVPGGRPESSRPELASRAEDRRTRAAEAAIAVTAPPQLNVQSVSGPQTGVQTSDSANATGEPILPAVASSMDMFPGLTLTGVIPSIADKLVNQQKLFSTSPNE